MRNSPVSSSRKSLISVILPAHNEEAWIAGCLDAVLASDLSSCTLEVIVVANGCIDETAARARSLAAKADEVGARLYVFEIGTCGKPGALTFGDAQARGDAIVYLDADVIVCPNLLGSLAKVLAVDAPRYAGGTPRLSHAKSMVSRLYGAFWMTQPFNTQGVPGYGLFAMNRLGRDRWGDWPEIVSDDTFARLNFTATERVQVPASYEWPLVEGFANLVRVRRRQDRGVRELAKAFPHLVANNETPRETRLQLVLRVILAPIAFGVYASVVLVVKCSANKDAGNWTRGR